MAVRMGLRSTGGWEEIGQGGLAGAALIGQNVYTVVTTIITTLLPKFKVSLKHNSSTVMKFVLGM